RDCRICKAGAPLRRPDGENRVVSEQKAAPAAAAGQDSRNLLMRILTAALLVPLTLAAAYFGGWLWTALVTLAVIGLDVEWLMVARLRKRPVVAAGVVALAAIGLCLALDRLGAGLLAGALGLLGVAVLTPQRRGWTVAGFLYAAAAQFAAVLVRADQQMGF